MSSSQQVLSEAEEDLSWEPLVLTQEKMNRLWAKFSQIPAVFDDFTRGSPKAFFEIMVSKDAMFYEIGDEVGIASAVAIRPRLDAIVHLTFFDRRLKGREKVLTDIMHEVMTKFQLRRLTAAVPCNRRIMIRYLRRLGFREEGVMRDAYLTEGRYLDMVLFGLLKEELK